MIIDELLVKLGFSADDKALKSFKEGLNGVAKSALKFTAVIEGAGIALSAFLTTTLKGVDEQAKFAREVGITVEQLQELEFAANKTGGSNQDLERSLRGVNRAVSQARDGVGSAVQVFGRLGISLSQNGQIKSTVQVLEDFSDRIRTLSPQQQTDFAQQIGISRSTLLLLKEGRIGIEELREEARRLGVVSTEDAKKAEEFTDAMRALRQVTRTLFATIATGLAPALTKLTDQLTELFLANKELITQNITQFIEFSLRAFLFLNSVLSKVVGFMSKVVDAVGGLRNAFELLAIGAAVIGFLRVIRILNVMRKAFLAAGAAAAILDGAAAAIPIAIAAGVAIAVLAIQDLITYFRGGESAVGKLIDKIDILKSKFTGIFKQINDVGLKVDNFFAKKFGFRTADSPDLGINTAQELQFQPVTSAPTLPFRPLQAANNETNNAINNAQNITQDITINVSGSNTDGKTLAEMIAGHIDIAARQAHRNNASTIAI